MNQGKSCVYGTHRVIDPPGVLPQQAWKIDNSMQPYANEILVDVDSLNIDSASFTEIKQRAQNDEAQVRQIIMNLVNERGKHHNPHTGSGGMFTGRVAAIGADLAGTIELEVGDEIASLVSLSLTPLHIDKITAVHMDVDQVQIEGQAILFASGIYAKLPPDMPNTLALAVLDVAGAPAQVAKLVRPGHTVVVIGAGGKSGLLCLHEAKKRAGITGRVIAVTHSAASTQRVHDLKLADEVIALDATQAVVAMEAISAATNGGMADLVVNCVNIPGTEMSSILAAKDGGVVYFFSMATSFTAAALGAEGVGKEVDMLIGNGYTAGHAIIALQILRENPNLYQFFLANYVK